MNNLYVDVILPLPLDGLFTYSVPAEWAGMVQPFVRAKVPFGITKTHTALIVRSHNNPPAEGITIKPLLAILDENPVLLPMQYKVWEWISQYYMSPLGDTLKAALPQGIKKEENYRPRTETYIGLAPEYQNEHSLHNALNILNRSPKQQEAFIKYLELSHWDELPEKPTPVTREELTNASHVNTTVIKALIDKKILRIYDVEVGRLNDAGQPHPEHIKPLSEAQQRTLDTINGFYPTKATTSNTPDSSSSPVPFKPTLLHGVTSSGKTEIYIHLIQEAIDRGEQVLYLLPEIALTVQIMQRLQYVFGNRLGIYHSRYSDAERVEIWQKQLSDHPYDIILGARSAVFLPFQRLGLVIIDEEHETSFKQQDPSPRYHARSVAMMMALWTKARIILGTATPSAESYYNAIHGKYNLVTLKERYKGLQLPHIEVINTKDLRHRKIMRGMLSPQLKNSVTEALTRGEQAILFLNRRGFSPIVECHQCGWTPRCPNCDVSLTYHKTMSSLTCHYCGHTLRMPNECPDCHNRELKDRGAGTEKVEEAIIDELSHEMFDASTMLRTARMDLDTTRTKNAYERIIAEFSAGKTNLLIGTQMVTKGLDFDKVSIVGILSADSMLNQPDFRAYEHSFMMMTQVAGRAGRKGHQGNVILQTSNPGLPVIKSIVANDYEGFFESLMRERREFNYPPFSRLVNVYLKHKDNNVVNCAAIELASRLRVFFPGMVLGPDKPSVSRVKLLFIRKIMLKFPLSLSIAVTRQHLREATLALLQDARYKSMQIYYDVDPL